MSETQGIYMISTNPIIAKCQAGQDLTWEEYCQGANRTLAGSDSFYGDEFDFDVALALIDEFIWVGEHLDNLKKALFYGKNIQDTYTMTQSCFYDSIDDYGHNWPSNVQPVAIHSILGIATESVELVQNLRQALVSNTGLDYVNLIEEFGDIFWYMHIPFIYAVINPDLNPVLRKNLLKLYARFGEKFEQGNAINRDLEAERKILETAI